jgi:Rieske Fe-S protein
MSEHNPSSSRREFLKLLQGLLAATGITALVGPILAYFWPAKLEDVPSDPVPVGHPESIAVGESKTIAYGRYPALIINTEEGIRAYSAVCTHFACIVKWNAESGLIECPCHEAFFAATDGAVLSGPAPRPLDGIATFVQDDVLFIGGEA